ncbi:calcium-binding protein KIC-like [Canna indica]|uniref:Calcium-binding protein KIC-like n=1 Tax=Canna indica TaxID=4628 RepID=A0AAQ3JW10_9LILI|nr:calcium-binding protein KIC-like [Canna indica]
MDSFGFHDFLPTMAERLGAEGLMEELCKGFQLLMDPERGVITFDSLKRSWAPALGLADEELMGMLKEGDLNGDGVLDQMEFCVLMVRLSPELMEDSERVVREALQASSFDNSP